MPSFSVVRLHTIAPKKWSYFAERMYFSSLIPKVKVTCMSITSFIFSLLNVTPFFFYFLSRGIRNADSHTNMISKWMHNLRKNGRVLIKTFEV